MNTIHVFYSIYLFFKEKWKLGWIICTFKNHDQPLPNIILRQTVISTSTVALLPKVFKIRNPFGKFRCTPLYGRTVQKMKMKFTFVDVDLIAALDWFDLIVRVTIQNDPAFVNKTRMTSSIRSEAYISAFCSLTERLSNKIFTE